MNSQTSKTHIDSVSTTTQGTPFKPRSTFCPVTANATLSTFTKKVDFEVDKMYQQRKNRPKYYNLTKQERGALEQMMKNDDLIIKRADKGGAVVVWGKDKYIKEVNRQLNDPVYYEVLKHNPTEVLKMELKTILTEAKENDWISDGECKFLFKEHPKLASFYLLPKIHKNLENPPGRPVISGIDSLTEPVSKYIDYFIKPILPQLPAYIQDTTAVLKKIQELGNIGQDTLLVTMDVESLYTSIVHEEGLAALEFFLQDHLQTESPPAHFLLKLTKWTLHNNIFIFQDRLFKQAKGCAMGACYSPSYAGLYMGKWENDFVFNSTKNSYLNKIIYYGRYIDDVLLLWDGSEAELVSFHTYLNGINKNIKLSLEYDKQRISFLDLEIYKDNEGLLHSTIYRKPTSRNTILHAKSFHPRHLKDNIPYGQFQRLKRICDETDSFEVKANEMENRFIQRGYKKKTIQCAKHRAKNLDRQSLLTSGNSRQSSGRIFFSTRFSTEANHIKNIIRKNWNLLQCDTSLNNVFQEPPVFSFKRAPTLNDKLVHSYLPPSSGNTWLSKKPQGSFKCGHCNHCPTIVKSKTFEDAHGHRTHDIRHFINCKTTFVIYKLECPLCNVFYIGRTKRRLQDRVSEHKYAIRTKNENYPMARHFKDQHNSDPAILRAIGIDHIPQTMRGGDRLKQLNQRESYWIFKLKATQYPGLNDEMEYCHFL